MRGQCSHTFPNPTRQASGDFGTLHQWEGQCRSWMSRVGWRVWPGAGTRGEGAHNPYEAKKWLLAKVPSVSERDGRLPIPRICACDTVKFPGWVGDVLVSWSDALTVSRPGKSHSPQAHWLHPGHDAVPLTKSTLPCIVFFRCKSGTSDTVTSDVEAKQRRVVEVLNDTKNAMKEGWVSSAELDLLGMVCGLPREVPRTSLGFLFLVGLL